MSGDHFRFLTELDGMSFPEAVERIADMAGVPMPARDPAAVVRGLGARRRVTRRIWGAHGGGDARLGWLVDWQKLVER